MLSRRALTSRNVTRVRSLATHAAAPAKNFASITPPYQHLLQQLTAVRKILDRPLSLAEKIVYSHLDNVEEGLAGGDPVRGEKYLKLRPDRVAMQGSSPAVKLRELQWLTVEGQTHRLKWRYFSSPLAVDHPPPSRLPFIAIISSVPFQEQRQI